MKKNGTLHAAEITNSDNQIRIGDLLHDYAEKYETIDFIEKDPSRFMHQVSGVDNQEVMAFIAACLSYGSRSQFIPKIQWLYDSTQHRVTPVC